MRPLRLGALLASGVVVLSAGASHAQAPPAAGTDTLSLSDAEKADVLSRNTEASVDAARTGLAGAAPAAGAVHGEIGGMIGSHGTRAAFGTATVPVGQNAQATLSFESDRTRWR